MWEMSSGSPKISVFPTSLPNAAMAEKPTAGLRRARRGGESLAWSSAAPRRRLHSWPTAGGPGVAVWEWCCCCLRPGLGSGGWTWGGAEVSVCQRGRGGERRCPSVSVDLGGSGGVRLSACLPRAQQKSCSSSMGDQFLKQ